MVEEALRAQSGAGAAHKRVRIGDIELAYDDEGEGDAIVCLHATGHGARDFEPFRERMRDRYRVICLDWPGHGRSQSDGKPPRASHLASLVVALLDHLGLKRVTVIGNSIGGAVALHLANEQPGRVKALVLANPAGLDVLDVGIRAGIAAMVRFFEQGLAGASWFPRAFAAYYRLVLPAGPAREQRERILAAVPETLPLITEAWRGFGMDAESTRDMATMLSRPVLFTWAMRDQFVRWHRHAHFLPQLRDVRIVHFSKAGHAPQLEEPDAFAAAVKEFLAEVADR